MIVTSNQIGWDGLSRPGGALALASNVGSNGLCCKHHSLVLSSLPRRYWYPHGHLTPYGRSESDESHMKTPTHDLLIHGLWMTQNWEGCSPLQKAGTPALPSWPASKESRGIGPLHVRPKVSSILTVVDHTSAYRKPTPAHPDAFTRRIVCSPRGPGLGERRCSIAPGQPAECRVALSTVRGVSRCVHPFTSMAPAVVAELHYAFTTAGRVASRKVYDRFCIPSVHAFSGTPPLSVFNPGPRPSQLRDDRSSHAFLVRTRTGFRQERQGDRAEYVAEVKAITDKGGTLHDHIFGPGRLGDR